MVLAVWSGCVLRLCENGMLILCGYCCDQHVSADVVHAHGDGLRGGGDGHGDHAHGDRVRYVCAHGYDDDYYAIHDCVEGQELYYGDYGRDGDDYDDDALL
jgi:hypothetical protein